MRETAHYMPGRVETEIKLILWRDKTMIKFIKNFRKDEAGAVTVDWVVLTAAVVGLAVAAYTAIETNTNALASGIATQISGETTSLATK